MEAFFNEFLSAYGNIIIIDFLRYFITASAAFLLFWILLRKVLNHRFIQPSWPKSSKLWYEFRYSLSTVLIFATIGTGVHLANQKGYIQVYHNIEVYGGFYFFLSLVIMLVFHDTYYYWTHRWMHHPKVYKYVHKVHHMSTNPSPWAAYSFHPLEAIIQAMVLPIILAFIPVHGIALFIFLTYMIVRNVHGHLGFELFPNRFIRSKWINWHTTTTHHNMHHRYFKSNFGLYFIWWDKLMKTNHDKYEKEFEEITSRKKSCLAKLKVLGLLILFSLSANAQSPQGKWMTFNEETGAPLSIIHIYPNIQTNSWEGKIDSIILQPNQGEHPICINCPGDFNNQPVIGLQFLWNFRKSGDEWTGGKVLDPESGNIYKSKIWFESSDEIKVRGYDGFFDLFYRTQLWRRMEGFGINGLWETIDDRYNQVKAHVRLQTRGNELVGTIQQIFQLPYEGNYPICVECEGDLKDKPIIGMRFMYGFKEAREDWNNGHIIDPANGATYSAKFWLEDKDTLIIRGYWGPFYRTQEWKRFD
ncbi:MAG: DUF2147 domain-containing protein [Reichenbachiella sp.]|uniref:DUF2147 domain-containing protein n=1 Tax=Reichenbachiella sp. TaxID=2184521 RepID=UPI003297CB56